MTLTKNFHLGPDKSRAPSMAELSFHPGPDESPAPSRAGLGSHHGLDPNARLVRFTFHGIMGKEIVPAVRFHRSLAAWTVSANGGGDSQEGSLPRWRSVFGTASSPPPDSIRASGFVPSPCKEGGGDGESLVPSVTNCEDPDDGLWEREAPLSRSLLFEEDDFLLLEEDGNFPRERGAV